MMSRQRNILSIFMLFALLLIGACGNSASSENLKSFPESVQDGTVSIEYYNQIDRYLTHSTFYFNEFNYMIEDLVENPALVYDKDFQEASKNSVKRHQEFISSFEIKSKSDIEKELDELFRERLKSEKQVVDSYALFFKSGAKEDVEQALIVLEEDKEIRELFNQVVKEHFSQ